MFRDRSDPTVSDGKPLRRLVVRLSKLQLLDTTAVATPQALYSWLEDLILELYTRSFIPTNDFWNELDDPDKLTGRPSWKRKNGYVWWAFTMM
ncbi:MAG: hypothetical protein Q9208_002941 [Pyrenodesmia sp. 3 TL-2023]